MDGNIFISYRRGPDSNAAGRLYDRLERNFPPETLFFDIDSIPIGVDFAQHIQSEVEKCDVQLVVIGPGWLENMPRLQNPDDFVRLEIEAALARDNIPVVPLLFDGAQMPTRDDLPESLQPLVRRNAIMVSHAQFSQIVDGRLTSQLNEVIADAAKAPHAASNDDKPEIQQLVVDEEASFETFQTARDKAPIESDEHRQHRQQAKGNAKDADDDILPPSTGVNESSDVSRTKLVLIALGAVIVVGALISTLAPSGSNPTSTGAAAQQETEVSPALDVVEYPGFTFAGEGVCNTETTMTQRSHATGKGLCYATCAQDTNCLGFSYTTSRNNCVAHLGRVGEILRPPEDAAREDVQCYIKN